LISDGKEIEKYYGSQQKIKVITDVTSKSAYQTMLAATTLIVPNSTFSLTAAFLSRNVRTICRPAKWSRKYINDNISDGIDKSEIKITNSFYPI